MMTLGILNLKKVSQYQGTDTLNGVEKIKVINDRAKAITIY